MIPKPEILSVATAAQLVPTTIEKDYALGWLLYGISKHPILSDWIFKGGTCLKKCYFETYRFSEDLDFTVPANAAYTKEEIKRALDEVAAVVYDAVGINLKAREIEVEESINKKGLKTFIARLTYNGPLNVPAYSLQRIKFDITNDEIISDIPVMRDVFNAYSDAPDPSTKIKCYSINEILAEKTRAMFERQGRARDIYDVVNISRNFRPDIDVKKAQNCLKKKFEFKFLPEPSVDLVFSNVNFDLLKANWENQLRHQVQVLPTVESFYNDLREALSWWIDEINLETVLSTIQRPVNEQILPRIHFPEWQAQSRLGIGRRINTPSLPGQSAIYLDHIRFAARNRLCIEITYHGVKRLVEPYSLRLPQTGNLLLYVYELRRGLAIGGGIKAYKVSEIGNAEITQREFIPKYAIEL
ncbi:MAG TPA: nucleotidyl transferase AbiEii/AbiGii toxin family protein [Chitinophagaceae bacterium]|nr:nucleotidyl transferase AbiEii/AbiGii toxin family protein [Chitinophagaceae bacterium]